MISPRIKKKDNTSMLTKPVLMTRSALNSSPKTSRPAPVSFNIGRMIRYDTQKARPTSTVSKILAKPSEYSSPSGVKEFIYIHTVEKTHYHSAVIIQRTWKRYKALKRLFRFLKFSHNIVFIENRYVFYTWLIRLTPPANVAKRIYANITQYLVDKSYKMNNNMRIATFDEFMKTNCIIVRKDIDYSKIIRCIRILNRPTLRKIISLWSEYAVDQVTVRRCQMKGNLLWKNRDKFDGEFIFFCFWRNYTNFKKYKKINLSLEAHMYTLEWALYRSKQETKFRMQEAADQRRRLRLLQAGFEAIRENSLYESKLEIKYHNCVKIFMRSGMQKVVRALINNVITQKFNHGILKRLIRAWYHAIDNEIIKKNSIGAFKRRNELKILSKIFFEWRKFSKQEMARYLKLIVDARNNELQFVRVIYLFQNDRIHFLVAEAFSRWRHIIKMKKRANRFVYWVFNYAQQREFKKFVLDIFKENVGRPMKLKDVWPFKGDTTKMYSNRHKKIGKSAKTAHFWRQIQKLIAKNEPIPFTYPTCTVSSSIYAIQNVNNFPLYGDWAETATGDQIRSLFYRTILLLTHSSVIANQNTYLSNKDQALEEFRDKYNLYLFSSFCELRDLLESEESDRRLTRVYRFQRDYDQLMSLEAHDAAQVFHTSWPVNFSLNNEPRTIFSIDSPMKSSEMLKVSKNYKDDNLENSLPEPHPFLQPIEQIKSQIIANNRKYLRKPEEIFTTNQKVLPTIITSQIPGHRKTTSRHEKIATGYENHVPIVLNPDITDMLLNEGEFKIQELKYLQDSAHKEVLKRQRTEDIKVINDSKKARGRQLTINPKDITKMLSDDSSPVPFPRQAKNFAALPKLGDLPNTANTSSTNNMAIEKGIMLSTVSSSFLEDKPHFFNPQKNRIETIMRKYLEFLNFLIFGSKSAFERVDFEMFHMRMIKIIGRLAEIAKKAKQKKKPKPKKKKNSRSPIAKPKPKLNTQSQLIQPKAQIQQESQDLIKSQPQLTQPQPDQQPEQIELKDTKSSSILKKKGDKSKSQLNPKSKIKFTNKPDEKDTESDQKSKPKLLNNKPLKKASSSISPRSKTLIKTKGKKKSPSPSSPQLLPQQDDQQQQPVDPLYFPFVKPEAHEDLTIDFFGKIVTNQIENLNPFDHFIGAKILCQHVKTFLFIDGNKDEVEAHLKREIEWVPDCKEKTNEILEKIQNEMKNIEKKDDEEVEKENEKENENSEIVQQRQQRRVVFQTVARLKSRAQRKTTVPDLQQMEEEKEKEKKKKEEEDQKAELMKNAQKEQENKAKSIQFPNLNEMPLIQRKFTFATDLIGAIISLSSFLSPYLLIFYEHPEQTESFTGIDELRNLIQQRLDAKETNIVVPEEIVTPPKTSSNKDDYIEFYAVKFAATTEDLTPAIRKRRVSSVGLNKKHRKTINLAAGGLNFEKEEVEENNNSSQLPNSTQPFTLGKPRGGALRSRRKSVRIFTPPKTITERDIDLFLCISPYAIPVQLLIQMIKSEIGRAEELIAELNRAKEIEEKKIEEQKNEQQQPKPEDE